MEPRIVALNQILLVGVPYYGDPQGGKFTKTWERFGQLESQIPNLVDKKVGFGLEVYGPEFMQDHRWTYFAAMEVSDLTSVPDLLFAKVLPAGQYAVFTVRGGIEKIGETFGYVYTQWMPASNFEVAHPFDFEYYDERFKDFAPDSEIDLYIPIKKKNASG